MKAEGSATFTETKTVDVTDIHSNTSQELVVITLDKLRLIIYEHKEALSRSREWQTPAGMVVTILLVFATTDFRDALLLSAATWRAFFLMALVLTILWLARNLWVLLKSGEVDDVVERIKKTTL